MQKGDSDEDIEIDVNVFLSHTFTGHSIRKDIYLSELKNYISCVTLA